jgi:hypothetical protein
VLIRWTIGPLVVAIAVAALAGSAYAISDRGAAQRETGRGVPATQGQEATPQGNPAGGGTGGSAQAKADLLATEFGVTSSSVMGLHEQGIGFGALFQLYAIARAKGVSVDSLLATAATGADGKIGLALGELKRSLTEVQLATLENEPKNLGQLVSASHKPPHANKP